MSKNLSQAVMVVLPLIVLAVYFIDMIARHIERMPQ